jgi:dienelactone hydrolase
MNFPRPWLQPAALFCSGCFIVASVAQTEAAALSHTNLMQFRAPDGSVHPVRTTNDWNARRLAILGSMTLVMGPLPRHDRTAPPPMTVEEEVDGGKYVRRLIRYESEPGSQVPAYLLIPKSALQGKERAPGALTLHQTRPEGHKVVVGLGPNTNDAYAVELAERGYICIAPAYPLLANYHPDLKALGYESGTMKAIWDNMRALDLLESLPYVKRGRFAAIGHSLGGHNAIYTAVFDERIQAAASSCGLDSYRDYKDGNITGWTSERYMPKLKQYAPDSFPFDFHEMIAALAPRSVFISAPMGDTNFKWASVKAIGSAARPIFELHGRPERLQIEHPDCGHVFPIGMRLKAYRIFDATLR